MKYASLLVIKMVFISITGIAQEQTADCKAVIKIINKINKNFSNGIYDYDPRRVELKTDSLGNTIYKIKGKNKDIQKLIEITNIKCLEDAHGGYTVTKEVLDEWNTWLIRNCRKK